MCGVIRRDRGIKKQARGKIVGNYDRPGENAECGVAGDDCDDDDED
jgi:hypothetical protein